MSVSQKQTVEIVKVLYRGADILILDEPTAVLTPAGDRQALRRPAQHARRRQGHRHHHPQAARGRGPVRPRGGPPPRAVRGRHAAPSDTNAAGDDQHDGRPRRHAEHRAARARWTPSPRHRGQGPHRPGRATASSSWTTCPSPPTAARSWASPASPAAARRSCWRPSPGCSRTEARHHPLHRPGRRRARRSSSARIPLNISAHGRVPLLRARGPAGHGPRGQHGPDRQHDAPLLPHAASGIFTNRQGPARAGRARGGRSWRSTRPASRRRCAASPAATCRRCWWAARSPRRPPCC